LEYIVVLLIFLAIFLLFLLKPEIGFLAFVLTSPFDHFLYYDNAGFRVKIYQVFLLAGLSAFLMMNLLSKKKIRRDRIFVILVLYWLAGFVSLGNADSFTDAAVLLIIELVSILIYFLVLQMTATEVRIGKTIKAIILSANFVALLSLMQVIGYNLGFKTRVIHTDKFFFGQPVGTFYESNWLGAFAMSMSLILIGLLTSRQKSVRRGYLTVSLCLQVLVLVLSMTRGAWLGFGFGLIVLVLVLPLSRERGNILRVARFASAVAVLLVTLGVGLYLVFPSLAQSVSDRVASFKSLNLDPESYSPEGTRVAKMARAIELIKRHPWIGCGPGQARLINSALRFYDPESAVQNRGTGTSNLFLSVLFQRGILGLSLFLAFLGLLFFKTIKTLKIMRDDLLKAVLRSLFISFCGLFFTFMFTENHLLAFFWIQIGLMVSVLHLVGGSPIGLENRRNG
jgi:O-antigen ligase